MLLWFIRHMFPDEALQHLDVFVSGKVHGTISLYRVITEEIPIVLR